MADYSYIGVGRVYLREYGASAGLREVGNCSGLSFAVNEDVKEMLDYTNVGGGTYNEVRRISSVESTITMTEFSPDNLALALFGSTTSQSAGTETDEQHTAYHDGFIVLSKVLNTISGVNSAVSGGGTSYVEGTDYELRPNGIYILSTGAISDASTVYITYTTSLADIVQSLVSSSKEYEIVFDGLNEAKSGKTVLVRVHRAKLGSTTDLSLIGDDFGALELSGKLLKDTTITTAGLSQYFTVQAEQ